MKAIVNISNKQIKIKELERFTRKLYIHRQKDRPIDEVKNKKQKPKRKNI
jgi:hypothetical protein